MNKLPLARSVDIVVQELGKEVLIYDIQTNKAFNLNETSAIVYKSCDGFASFEELKTKHKFTDEIIFLALDQLKKQNLIEEKQNYQSPFAGMNRREVIRKVGLASMIALPVISSLVAPTAAMAQSGLALRAICTSSSQCASGNCSSTSSRCCVPGTLGLVGSNFCCADTASCNSACCTGSGTIIDPGACPTINFPLRVMCS